MGIEVSTIVLLTALHRDLRDASIQTLTLVLSIRLRGWTGRVHITAMVLTSLKLWYERVLLIDVQMHLWHLVLCTQDNGEPRQCRQFCHQAMSLTTSGSIPRKKNSLISCPKCLAQLQGPPSLPFKGYWALSYQRMKLTIHLHPVLRLRIGGGIPLLPLYAFMAYRGTICF